MTTAKSKRPQPRLPEQKRTTPWVPHADRIDLKTVPSLMETTAASWGKS